MADSVLDVTIGTNTANSYVTLSEADAYIAERFPSAEANDWASLSQAAKETRLLVAANLLSALPFTGIRASIRQTMAWPRLFPRDTLYKKGSYGNQDFFETFEDVEDAAEEYEVDPPEIPDAVKHAQVEISWQVVHRSLLSLDSGTASSNARITSVSISGGFSITAKETGDVDRAISEYLGGRPITSLSYIQALLAPYLTRVRWRSV